MKLVLGSELRDYVQLGSLDRFVAACDDAVEQALPMLENDLRTPLEEDTYSDVYLLDLIDLNPYRLKLKTTAGFITGDLAIGTGTTLAEAQADTSLTDEVAVNMETGLITISQYPLSKFVSVRYSAGFPARGSPNTDTLDLSTAKTWLQRGSMIASVIALADHPEFATKEGRVIDSKGYKQMYQQLIVAHIRYLPGTITPLA